MAKKMAKAGRSVLPDQKLDTGAGTPSLGLKTKLENAAKSPYKGVSLGSGVENGDEDWACGTGGSKSSGVPNLK